MEQIYDFHQMVPVLRSRLSQIRFPDVRMLIVGGKRELKSAYVPICSGLRFTSLNPTRQDGNEAF